jgi:hypothetical protein
VSRSYERAFDLLYARVYGLIAQRSCARLPRKTLARAHDLVAERPRARLPLKRPARSSDPIPERPPARWSRRTLAAVLLLAVGVAAVTTWLQVAKTMRDADPVPVPKVPRVTGVVWSNRVFVDAASLRRWLIARNKSYTVWARNHPRALALLARRSRR